MGGCTSYPKKSESKNPPQEAAGATTAAAAASSSKPTSSPSLTTSTSTPPLSEQEFKKRYQLKGTLGEGNYSVVKKAVDLDKNIDVAVKVVDRRKLMKDDELALKVEVEILGKMDHPNIIKLHGWYVEGKNYCIVTELMNGGELFDRIVKKEFYSEADAQKVVITLAEVIKYIHGHGIVHRDLKPENILLTDDTDNALIKIADFGFARPIGDGLKTACGTPGYVAPEIIGGKTYGKSVDVWSLGVIIYILLCGYPPFYNTNQANLFKAIREGKFVYDSPYWDDVSNDAKNLISSCLTVDVSKRLDIEGVLKHPWLSGKAESKDITKALTELKKFNARRKLRAAIKAAIAANRLIEIANILKADSN